MLWWIAVMLLASVLGLSALLLLLAWAIEVREYWIRTVVMRLPPLEPDDDT